MALRSRTKIKKTPKRVVDRVNKLSEIKKAKLKVAVGLPAGSNDYPDGTSLIMVGTVHEFGSPVKGIPARSFLRATVKGNKRKYKRDIAKIGKRIVSRDFDFRKGLNTLGQLVASDVVERISGGIAPALKSREGTALVDTGHLRQSITYELN